MTPDLSSLTLYDPGPDNFYAQDQKFSENGNMESSEDRYIQKLRHYVESIPYSVEPYSRMMKMFDHILLRIVQCVEAKDYDPGFMQWDSMVTYWSMLKYPIPKDKRILLAKLYFQVSVTPGMSAQVIATCADGFKVLTQSKKKVSVKDMRLPWKPIYEILKQDLFLDRRQFEYTQLSWCMGYIAENSRRFFHPAAINDMLSTFIPSMDGTVLDTILSSQYYLLSFLPLSHPQSYLPMLMRMWESINSYMYDERMLHFLAKLAEMHVSPHVSDPRKIAELPDDEISEGEKRPRWSQDDVNEDSLWPGLYKDVGIFTDQEWSLLMCKCLASMEIPLADSGSLTTGPSADNQAGFEIGRLPKPGWRISSLARIIVYSMAPDGIPAPPSNLPTPLFTPLPSGMNTPAIQTSTLKDYLSAPLSKGVQSKNKTYIAGSRALDSLVRFIASVQDFFHISNSGSWTNDLSAFIKYIVYDFNKRWHEERQPDCETPMNHRLTKAMRRELVKSLRVVCLLAMFSQDSTTVSNIQSCLKSMSIMEPDLILHPILERAVPSLETLVETQRTTAVIKALGAVAPALVSREVYYPGAKYLVPILDLLIPGIDLNDPSKTLCTTSFLVEISQYIKFGDLTTGENKQPTLLDSEHTEPKNSELKLPSLSLDEPDGMYDLNLEPRLSHDEEDMLLKDTTASFADWIASFIRRVIQLMENLPEEGPNGTAGGTTELQVVNAVAGACNQICVHLSEPLYDLVLNMVYDYASTNVRSNAVRAIHQLVECIANANPDKTLAKFLPFCERNIRIELENGASSLRTTSSSTALPSDATLHWNLAILRGTVYNDGRAVLRHKETFLSLLKFLHSKTLSKRGFSWTGKLLSSMLLTLTHTYPLENKFVNPDEWNSKEFDWDHHRYWGKLYAPGEVKVSWHVPNDEEIDFTIRVFRELIEPTLSLLEGLLQPGVSRDAIWRNDFCRHLSLVRNAFSGVPTFMKQYITPEEAESATMTSDILDEIPEMIASCEPLKASFCLTDPSTEHYIYMHSLRNRFGQFLHKASVSLRQQGEENTVDAVQMLLRSIKTYLLEYGDSRDGYYVNQEQYTSAKNVARQYAKQKVWPRAVHVRRARFYHSARLRWNAIERLRGPLEDGLIDDVTQWSIWHYAVVRISSQSLLENLCAVYDGIRRRALPILYDALKKGKDVDDDRMKGALWTLNLPSFGKHAVSEPKLAKDIFVHLLGCQHNEKQSIQNCVSMVTDTCLASFIEPSYLVHNISAPSIDKILEEFKCVLGATAQDITLINKCSHNTIRRVYSMNEAADETGSAVMAIGESSETHWRYAIVALRCLRTLIRRDKPLTPSQMSYFLSGIHDSHPTIRYYAQRAVMKSTRNIKLRSYCPNLVDLYEGRNHNPLRVSIPIEPLHSTTLKILEDYKSHFDLSQPSSKTLFHDKAPPGWAALSEHASFYRIPDSTRSTFVWEEPSAEAIAAARKITTDPNFWKKLSNYLAEETHETVLTQDNVSCVKSIFQLLEDAPFEALRPKLESLLADKEADKQRAAAELLAGVIGGSRHWPLEKQQVLWKWYKPYITKIFGANLKSDTVSIWTSFLEYLFYNKDPRRIQPLFDHLMELYKNLDYNTELSFDAVRILSLFRASYEQLGRKFISCVDEVVERCWSEIHSEHEDVRAYVAEILAFADKIKWQPRPSIPSVEVLIKECRLVPSSFDIMGMRGNYHKQRVNELVVDFKTWSKTRDPGVRAFQSDYDRAGVTVCKWLFQSLHDTNAISVFDYILPLMPELFRFTDLSDNDDLSSRAKLLLVRMCGVSPPRSLINPILDAIFEAIQSSPSWRVRLKALPLVQIFYFRQFFLISDIKITEILEVVCKCLDDEVVEVREMAATTLSGILRLSPRSSVLTLKKRFVRLAKDSHIPDRHDPTYTKCIRQRHAAILGICALVDSYPYTVEKWMPDLLTNVLAEYTYDPIPISNTVRKCARNFKKTHQDTWHEDSKRFDDSQLAALSTLLTGSSYYA
ncbi:ARM repeat-containing protein [Marasmius fiardii PR-910]|nr:ARM repeat-containing protein [Marasmius fiardii PR-910]